MSKNYTMHVISHTHWDREWYRPFQQFRMRLVDLIDELIKLLESDLEYKCFRMVCARSPSAQHHAFRYSFV